jgi:serine/threonine-protein kinase HipA
MKDDHARNFAFCMDGAGQWSLSLAFDLCPSTGFGISQEHTTALNGKGTNISCGDLMAFADSIALSPQLAREGIDNARAASAQFEALAVSLGATRAKSKQWAKVFKAIDAHLQPVMVPATAPKSALAKPKKGNDLVP